jgi:uncharacterized protein (DUF58 family)
MCTGLSASKKSMSKAQNHYMPVTAAGERKHLRKRAGALARDMFTLQRYRVTLEGLSLVCVSTLIGFAAWHSGTNLLYLVFATLIALFLIHGLLVWLSVVGIKMERILPVHVYAGRPCPIAIRVYNKKGLLDSRGLRVSDLGHNGKAIGIVFFGNVPRNGYAEELYETVFPTRGAYKLRNLEAITRYPFGLVERGLKINTNQELLVYPPVDEVGALGTNLVAGFGDQEVREKGTGTELYGLREYVPGEHARHIHWRSSARLNKLMVMEYERDERRHVTLLLWNVAAGPPSRQLLQDFENAVNLTASLANYLIREGFELRLSTALGSTADGQGRRHLYTLLRVLATLPLVEHGEEQASIQTYGSVVNVRFQNENGSSARRADTVVVDARQFTSRGGKYVRAGAQ